LAPFSRQHSQDLPLHQFYCFGKTENSERWAVRGQYNRSQHGFRFRCSKIINGGLHRIKWVNPLYYTRINRVPQGTLSRLKAIHLEGREENNEGPLGHAVRIYKVRMTHSIRGRPF